MKINYWVTITSPDLSILHSEVNELIANDYQPFGSIVVTGSAYYQAMVKYEEEIVSPETAESIYCSSCGNYKNGSPAEDCGKVLDHKYIGIDPAKLGADKSICSSCGEDMDDFAREHCPYPTNHKPF